MRYVLCALALVAGVCSGAPAGAVEVTRGQEFSLGKTSSINFQSLQSVLFEDGETTATIAYAPSDDYNIFRIFFAKGGKLVKQLDLRVDNVGVEQIFNYRAIALSNNELGIFYASHSFSSTDSIGGFHYARVSPSDGVLFVKKIADVTNTGFTDNSNMMFATKLKSGKIAIAYQDRETVRVGRLTADNDTINTLLINERGDVLTKKEVVTPRKDKELYVEGSLAQYSQTYFFGGLYYGSLNPVVALEGGGYAILYIDQRRSSGAMRIYSKAGLPKTDPIYLKDYRFLLGGLPLDNGGFTLLYNVSEPGAAGGLTSSVAVSPKFKLDKARSGFSFRDSYTGEVGGDPSCLVKFDNGNIFVVYAQTNDLRQIDLRYRLMTSEGRVLKEGDAVRKNRFHQRTPSCAKLGEDKVFYTYVLQDGKKETDEIFGATFTISDK